MMSLLALPLKVKCVLPKATKQSVLRLYLMLMSFGVDILMSEEAETKLKMMLPLSITLWKP